MNPLMRSSKLTELINSIKNNSFPIILIGPSASGKTFLIEKALEILQLKYKYVESTSRISNPLDNRIIHTVLNNTKDIENTRYNRRMIIETSLNIEKMFPEGTVIKTHKNEKDSGVDLYRFLGRIFYKKMKIGEIEVEGDRIIYSIINYNSKKRVFNKKQEKNKKIGGYNSKNDIDEREDTDRHFNRRFLIKEESSSEISFDEDLIFSDESPIDNQQSIDLHVKRLKKFVDETEIPQYSQENSISYDLPKIEGYIYQNFLDFVDLEDASVILESLSLLDSHRRDSQTYFPVLIKSILNSKEQKKEFRSFKSKKLI